MQQSSERNHNRRPPEGAQLRKAELFTTYEKEELLICLSQKCSLPLPSLWIRSRDSSFMQVSTSTYVRRAPIRPTLLRLQLLKLTQILKTDSLNHGRATKSSCLEEGMSLGEFPIFHSSLPKGRSHLVP